MHSSPGFLFFGKESNFSENTTYLYRSGISFLNTYAMTYAPTHQPVSAVEEARRAAERPPLVPLDTAVGLRPANLCLVPHAAVEAAREDV